MGKTLGVVLAGGRGKRMDILCHLRPKPSLPFAGAYRVIDFCLSCCLHSGIRDVAVLIDYQRSEMAKYLRRWYSANAGLASFRILEPKAGSYKGTADAVYQNVKFLQADPSESVLVLAGDHIYKMDYQPMLDFHRHQKADVTVGVVTVPIEQAHRFGIATVDNQGRIVDFLEKPKNPQSNLTSMGIYVFNKHVLIERLEEDAAQQDSPHDFGYAVIPDMVKRDRVVAYEFNGYWQDIGTAEAYYEANMELTKQKPRFTLDSARPVFTEVNDLPATKIYSQGSVNNSLVSPGCVIKGHVENSVLSPGVRIEEQAVVRDSIVMTNTFIDYHSIVDRSILDEEVNVGKYCYIGLGKSLVSGEWDITVVGKGVTVPPHTAIGRDCRILPHVGPHDFHGQTVPSGVVLSH